MTRTAKKKTDADKGSILSEVITKYISDRDKIAELKKELEAKVEAIEAMQAKREAFLLGQLNTMGVDSVKAKGIGTFFKQIKDSATVSDREAFFAWIGKDFAGRSSYLDSRVSKTKVKEDVENKKTPPPGINYTTFTTVGVRRA